jgi:hypothetical protein
MAVDTAPKILTAGIATSVCISSATDSAKFLKIGGRASTGKSGGKSISSKGVGFSQSVYLFVFIIYNLLCFVTHAISVKIINI